MSNSKESPYHKRKKMETSPLSLSSLPYDVALNCLARVSRLDQVALSLTSKSYRSLIASSDFYKTRMQLGRTDNSLYICLRPPSPDTNPLWYILRRRKSSDLIPIHSLPSQPLEASCVVVLDSGIYVIGGLREGKKRTSDVFHLDCRTHKWSIVPCMGVARANAAAGVVDGKIYVFGGCEELGDYSWSYGEVFDPKTQTWDSLPLPKALFPKYIHNSVVWDQKIYALNKRGRIFYYSPSQDEWGIGNSHSIGDWCVVDSLLCCYNRHGTIFWCEPEGMVTKEVKGLDFLKEKLYCSSLVHFDQEIVDIWERYKYRNRRTGNLKDFNPGFRLTNSGPNIMLFWDVLEGKRLEIWCAEISLERRGSEIWGNVERINVVMTVDPFLDRYKVLYSASVLV